MVLAFSHRFLAGLLLLVVTSLTVLPTAATTSAAPQTDSTEPEWTVSDDGAFVTAENAVLKLRFAYNATGQQGWFVGSGTGGGGRDGAIVELYHKPTSPTRNLIFRNGTWGSGYDAFDVWEADKTAVDRATFNDPDTSSNRNGRVVSRQVRQSAGRLLVDFEVDFASWRLSRHYLVYPSGQITISTDVRVIQEGAWNYLAHRFNFAGSQYQVVNGQTLQWGGDYQNGSGHYLSWTDGVDRYNGRPVASAPENGLVDQVIRADAQTNTTAHYNNRTDSYSGFLIKGNGVSPAVMVIQGAKNDWEGPFSAIARKVGQDPRSLSTDYRSYVETALFSFNWAPNNLTQVGTTWFYMTTPGQSPDGNIWNKRGYWATNLGTWNETFHVFIDPNLQNDDYLPRWAERARDLVRQAPTDLIGATSATLGQYDQIYHVQAAAGAAEVSWRYRRAASDLATRPLSYGTSFVVDNVDRPVAVLVNGVTAALPVHYDVVARTALVTLDLPQAALAESYQVSLRTVALEPTATATATPVPATSTSTPTTAPPTATRTETPVPPTATATATATPVPPTATATRTPVPPTATATATRTPVPPTPTATATPIVALTQVAYPSSADTRQSAAGREWKNSLLQVRDGLTLRQIGFMGGAGQRYELRRSTGAGGWGEIVLTGNLSTTASNGFYVANVTPTYLAPDYYTLHVWVDRGSYTFGNVARTYPEVSFLKSSAGATDVNAASGTYQIRLIYNP